MHSIAGRLRELSKLIEPAAQVIVSAAQKDAAMVEQYAEEIRKGVEGE